ncbi:EamA family transporter RarD [Vibrio astriarenae]|uniref:EamA family transporter RarD n=1 Tax=Vibrio astriarenae TaxID=1481923 RepID=A0A7Z2T0M4_9VIBR|nr:EamA family transporter RarD [Vibrio astriarenae]QIA62144.1 EamA family transporter RarD [Vibrio astriarenae]
MSSDEQQRTRQGILLAIAAYSMWGIAPIYFKSISDVSPLEILSHRVIWSVLLLAGLLHLGRRWRAVRDAVRTKKTMLYLCSTALLVGVNWLLFIWAVNSNRMLDASLGYYINPLLNVLLGMFFLGERLRKLQWFAVALATLGVIIQLIAFGSVPIVALALASTFGVYGLLRKKVALDAQVGLFIETVIMMPLAALYLFAFANSPTSSLLANDWSLNLLLISAGIVTTLPLLCFTGAATRLKLSTLGFFQYIGPSLMFLLAVSIYGEDFSADKVLTFTFIWSALVVFTFDGIRNSKRGKA